LAASPFGSEFLAGASSTIAAAVVLTVTAKSWSLVRLRRKKQATARSISRSTSKHHESFDWLVRRYGSHPESGLYVTKRVAPGKRLAFYSPTSWNTGPFEQAQILDFSNYERITVPLDHKVLRRFGQRIPMNHEDGTPWNDSILVARHVHSGPRASLACSTYFEFLSTGGALQLELEDAMRRRRPRTPRRDDVLPSPTSFADGSLPLMPVGANVTTVLLIKPDDLGPAEARLLLQVRASSVAVSPGLHNVVPSFGILAPTDGAESFDLKNDLVREYLEELRQYEDVVHTSQRTQASQYWYLGDPLAKDLLKGLETGKHTFEILGMGVDLVHAGLHIACILTLSASRQDLYDLKANWEGRIFDIDLFSPKVDKLVESDSFQPDGTYAVDLARDYLWNLRQQEEPWY
jgi:hypothetical protein